MSDPIEVMAIECLSIAEDITVENAAGAFTTNNTNDRALVARSLADSKRIIEALDAAGYAIVPKVATGPMVEASVMKTYRENKGIEYAPSQVWEAMVEIGAVKP